jgi:hypothetical protein
MPVAGCGGAEEGKNLDQESALARVSAARMPPTLERARRSAGAGPQWRPGMPGTPPQTWPQLEEAGAHRWSSVAGSTDGAASVL